MGELTARNPGSLSSPTTPAEPPKELIRVRAAEINASIIPDRSRILQPPFIVRRKSWVENLRLGTETLFPSASNSAASCGVQTFFLVPFYLHHFALIHTYRGAHLCAVRRAI